MAEFVRGAGVGPPFHIAVCVVLAVPALRKLAELLVEALAGFVRKALLLEALDALAFLGDADSAPQKEVSKRV